MGFLRRFTPSHLRERATLAETTWAQLSPKQKLDFFHEAARQRVEQLEREFGRRRPQAEMAGGAAVALTGGAGAFSFMNPPGGLMAGAAVQGVMGSLLAYATRATRVVEDRLRQLERAGRGSRDADVLRGHGYLVDLDRSLGHGWSSPERVKAWMRANQTVQVAGDKEGILARLEQGGGFASLFRSHAADVAQRVRSRASAVVAEENLAPALMMGL
ncbi:MAG: hypothetical protein HKL99_10880 [Burkholderiales bacterium]|nr:hypothetical protein [Burkholderiales bacterium]